LLFNPLCCIVVGSPPRTAISTNIEVEAIVATSRGLLLLGNSIIRRPRLRLRALECLPERLAIQRLVVEVLEGIRNVDALAAAGGPDVGTVDLWGRGS
jgi:hypothetical protein